MERSTLGCTSLGSCVVTTGAISKPDRIHVDKKQKSTFTKIRDANQKQVDGTNKKKVESSKIKRKITITVNKKEKKDEKN